MRRFLQLGPAGVAAVGLVAVVAVVVALVSLRSASQRSDRVDELEGQLAAAGEERDDLEADQRRLTEELAGTEERAAVNESRWLAAVAVSGEHSPTDSRLLAVEALSRHPTAEAEAALGTLLFADSRTDPPVTPLAHGGPVWAAETATGVLVTGSDDATARLWSEDGTLVTAFDHGDAVRAAAVAPAADGAVVATGSNDGVVTVWTVDGEVLAKAEHDDDVTDVAIDAGATLLVSAARDGRVQVTDVASGQLEHELVHDDIVWTAALSPDLDRVATGSADGLARLWDLQSGQVIASHDLNQSVTVVSFSPDGRWLFAGGQSSRPLLLDGATGSPGPALDATLGGGIVDVDWRPDGAELAVVALRGTHRFALPDGELIGQLPVAGGSRGVAYGPDGSWLVTASGDFQFSFGAITFWDAATGRETAVLNLGGPVESVAVQPGTGTVLAGYRSTEELVEVGGAWLVPGPDDWVALACAGTEGTISDLAWAAVTGDPSPPESACR